MLSREFFIHLLLVLTCATGAVALQLWLYSPPTQMLSLSMNGASLNIVNLPAIEIVGIKDRIDWNDSNNALADINRLWARFESSAALHEMLDWRSDQVVFAYYDLSVENLSEVPVIIGYALLETNRTTDFQSFVTDSGRYQHYAIERPDTSRVTEVWQEISSKSPLPLAVIERYQFDALGQIQAIEMQVKTK